MCRFCKLLLSFFCKDGRDWLKKKKKLAAFSCWIFLCIVLAAASLKYHWYCLLWLQFCLELSFHCARSCTRTHTHSLSSRSFSDTHTHTHTHLYAYDHMDMPQSPPPPHLFLSLSLPEVLQFLLFSSMLLQTWPGVQPQSRSSFSPGISFVTKCSATPNWEK